MADIAEGHGRRTNLEFANFIIIAHGSVAEVKSHLYVAVGLEYINQNDFDDFHSQLTEISRMTLSRAQYLRGK